MSKRLSFTHIFAFFISAYQKKDDMFYVMLSNSNSSWKVKKNPGMFLPKCTSFFLKRKETLLDHITKITSGLCKVWLVVKFGL